MVIHGQQAGLFILIGPPLVDGGIMLPEFAQRSPFPAAAGLGDGRGRTDQKREVSAGVSGDRFAVAYAGEAGGEFVGDELIVGRPLEPGPAGERTLLSWEPAPPVSFCSPRQSHFVPAPTVISPDSHFPAPESVPCEVVVLVAVFFLSGREQKGTAASSKGDW